jgi:hypothetical protein
VLARWTLALGISSTSEAQVVVQNSAKTQQEILAVGWHTTPAEAMKLEAELKDDPENLALRVEPNG